MLFPFELNEFDVILGMDWLGENLAGILCGRKMVCINPPRREPFVVYGDKSKIRSGIIAIMKAIKRLTKGFSSFLAYAIDAREGKKRQ